MTSAAQPKALLLGIRGGLGKALSQQLLRHNWEVRALVRQLKPPYDQAGRIEWIQGDVMDEHSVLHAAKGCDLIFHGVNPPHYLHWDKLVLPMLRHSIHAARTHDALLVLPGNLYNYGPYSFVRVREDALQQALTRKGQLRVAMEQALQQASHKGVRSLIVRSGDFFGPDVPNSWFTQALVRPNKRGYKVYRIGRPGVGHQWAYVPDVAATIMALIQQAPTLERFARFHMRGHWDATGEQMLNMVVDQLRATSCSVQIKDFPWRYLQLASPFVPRIKELLDMRYLWEQSVYLDNSRLLHFLGHEPHTVWPVAIAQTLQSMGLQGK